MAAKTFMQLAGRALPLLWATLVGLMAVSTEVRAVVPEGDLYQTVVPVQDQGPGARNAAVGQALEAVLVRLTGRRAVGRRAAVRQLRREATKLVQQYRYEPLPAPPDDNDEARLLLVRFDPAALQQALIERGLSAWTSPRPTLLLWLAVEEQGQRRLLQGEGDAALKAAVYEVAERRGIGLLLPRMDLEDLNRLRPSDLWQGDPGRLRAASRRYPADLVLTARVRVSAAGTRADWQLLHPQRSEDWQSRGKAPAEALTAGLEEAIDRVAAAYAPVGGGAAVSGVLVQVLGVRDLDGYLRVDRFLRGLDGVEQVLPVQVQPEQVLWRVRVRGGAAALDRSAALGHPLSAEPLPPAQDSTSTQAPPPMPTPGADGQSLLPDLTFRLTP